MILPLITTAISDALVALGRVSKFLTAEELSNQYIVDDHSKYAVKVDGTFTWETVEQLDSVKLAPHSRKPEKRNKQKAGNMLPLSKAEIDDTSSHTSADQPFELQDLRMTVPKGSFVAIVGRVGSGKVYCHLAVLRLSSR